MGTKGGPEHESELAALCARLRSEGYVVVRLDGKSPDAVACKGGHMVAVEVVTQYGADGNYKLTRGTYSQKRKSYMGLGFEDVMFGTVKLDRERARKFGTGWFATADRILHPP